MLGDVPDPTVTKIRFGFGTNFGRARGSDALCKEGLRFKQEGKQRTRLVSEGSAEARGARPLWADASFMKTNENDAMKKCNNKINNRADSPNKEGNRSVGLGASHLTRNFRIKIFRIPSKCGKFY